MTTTAVPLDRTTVPLAAIATTRRPHRIATTVCLAAGSYLRDAPNRAIADLMHRTGPTRAGRVIVANYPPDRAAEVLDQLAGCDTEVLAGARLAVAACDEQPFLWLFVASCQVLWTQPVDQVGQS